MTKPEVTRQIEQKSGLKKLTYDEALKIRQGDKVFANVENMLSYCKSRFNDPFHQFPVMFNNNLTFSVKWKSRTVVHARWNVCYVTPELQKELQNR